MISGSFPQMRTSCGMRMMFGWTSWVREVVVARRPDSPAPAPRARCAPKKKARGGWSRGAWGQRGRDDLSVVCTGCGRAAAASGRWSYRARRSGRMRQRPKTGNGVSSQAPRQQSMCPRCASIVLERVGAAVVRESSERPQLPARPLLQSRSALTRSERAVSVHPAHPPPVSDTLRSYQTPEDRHFRAAEAITKRQSSSWLCQTPSCLHRASCLLLATVRIPQGYAFVMNVSTLTL